MHWLLILGGTVFAALAGALVLIYTRSYLSRPLLDGSLTVSGIDAPVKLARDAEGIPLVSAASRADAAYGLGFLHAQERFFQMDLARRGAAGELAELIGSSAVAADRKVRVHQFRKRAQRILAALEEADRQLLDAYAAGVGEGLRRLRAAPLEYLLLRATPVPWQPEDTLLTVFRLYCALQDARADQDFNRHLLYSALPRSIAEFLTPEGSPDWDAPLVGPTAPALKQAGPEELDFRRAPPQRLPDLRLVPELVAGSNAWAVSGAHTKSGKAMVANDLHLPFEMPSVFYRATLEFEGRGAGVPAGLSGITVPGFPFVLAGTNGKVAWGITNAAIDAVDLVRLDQTGLSATSYRTAQGVKELETERELIRVRGGAELELVVTKTEWGPVTRKTREGDVFAQVWLAYRDGAVNLAWRALEESTSVSAALEAANRIGGPTLAIIAGDTQGDIGWTLAGPLPRRADAGSPMPRLSSQVAAPERDGAEAAQYPRLKSPEFSKLWTANARAITSGGFGKLLAGGYHVCGARAAQIRDVLLALETLDERAMLRIQRDDRAHFLVRWHALYREVLSAPQMKPHPRLDEVRTAVAAWDGRAAAQSTAYRLLRQFREEVERLVFEPFISSVRARYGQFDLHSVTNQLETPLWSLLDARPQHLLAPWFADWDELLACAARSTLDAVPHGTPLRAFVWGAVNRLVMRHPLSRMVPLLGRWLDAPRSQLDGDLHMPLAQTAQHGPVCRFVISPGENQTAIAQICGGQSGNRLAPYYLAGHEDWLHGRPSPLQPGVARYTLTLQPVSARAQRPRGPAAPLAEPRGRA